MWIYAKTQHVIGSIKDDCYEKEPEHFLISGSLLDWDLNLDSNPGQAWITV